MDRNKLASTRCSSQSTFSSRGGSARSAIRKGIIVYCLAISLISSHSHRVCTRFPTSWAHFSVSIGVLECLDQSQCLVDRPSHWQIIHCDLSQNALVIDNEEASEGVSQVVQIHAVFLRYLVAQVTEQWDLDVAQSSLFPRRVYPCQMRKVGVYTAGNHLRINLLELVDSIGEGQNLGGTNEGEVERVEEEDDVFPQVVAQG